MLLNEWANIGSFDFYTNKVRILATNELSPEKWSSSGRSDYNILKNYIRYTFEKLWDEREQAPEAEKQDYIYEDDNQACFNTGLFDKTWQPVYFYCVKNKYQGYQKYEFNGFFNEYTIKFTNMPPAPVANLRRPNYFDDPSALIYNVKLNIVPQWQHIIYTNENFLRIPEAIRVMGQDMCRNGLTKRFNFWHRCILLILKSQIWH